MTVTDGVLRRRRLTAFVAMLGVGPALVAGAALSGSAPASATVQTVCGTKVPDATFMREGRVLGLAHACAHLRSRQVSPATRHRLAEAAAATRSFSALSVDPVDVGAWSAATNPGTKTIGISAVMLRTGKVLIFGGKYRSIDKNTASYLFDPVTGTGHEVPAPAAVFCGSVTALADGRILSVGGADPIPHGITDLWIFDPVTEQWTRQPDSPRGRYYPTSTKLSDGRVVVTAGTELDGSTNNPKVEVYTPPAAGQTMGTLQVVGPDHATSFYPRQWAMPDGTMLQVANRNVSVLDPSTWTWKTVPRLSVARGSGPSGLMLPAGPAGSTKVMMIGGQLSGTARNTTEWFDQADPTGGWHAGNPMPTTRSHMNVVQVPDGSAFGIGGNSSGLYNVGQAQTMQYNPADDTWTNMAVQTPRRAYHSTAVLLPDGRIMSAGDTGAGGGRQLIDFYSPPYLFKGPRPVISSAPAAVAHGQQFTIDAGGADATRAVLMAPAATTHANDMNARHVELSVTKTTTGFTATAPSATVAPPGYYMLFTVTASGVPSVATWVKVGP